MLVQSVTTLYAGLAQSKTLMAHSRAPELMDAHLTAGKLAGDALISTKATGPDEVLLKLTELLDWMADDGHPDQVALLRSAIEDLRDMRQPVTTPTPTPPAVKAPQPETAPKVRVDRRARPIVVDGKLYASIFQASVALKVPYSKLRAQSLAA